VNAGAPETTWYVYDGDGKRVRKVTEQQAAAGATPGRKDERYYLDGVELYREYGVAGALALERRQFDVMDDRQRVAILETEGGRRLVRYQSVDHLGSSHLETDEHAKTIGYEEYHPFGTTAYQAVDKDTKAAVKRYRYTGMERDEESGLEYHGARYYAPWLGRWTAPDKHAEQFDGNRYAYVKNNPVVHRDPNGLFEEPVHGILTYRLALAAGIPQKDAARIAIATAAMDHDRATEPATVGDVALGRRIPETEQLHFEEPQAALADVKSDIAAARGSARSRPKDLEERFGRHLHTLEDVGFVDAPGPHMRGKNRILSPTLALLGTASLLGGTAWLGLALSSSASTGSKVAQAIVAVLLIGFGIYLLQLASRTQKIGHPTHETERGELSLSFNHVADQAPQDPRRNTDELRKIYGVLKDYSRARYGTRRFDDPGAQAAIEQAIQADTSCLVSNFANARPRVHGQRVPSYTEILSTRPADKWTPQHMDVTLPAHMGQWLYEGKPGLHQACPAR
jgi:RHS repeat-associated protein